MSSNLPTKVPTPDTTPASTSLLYIVDDPYGTPADNATTLANAVTKGHGLSDTTVLGVASGAIAAASTTGTGAVVRATSPALVTPTGIVKGDVGLGNVDNTSNATERAAVAALTNKDLTSGTNTFPTLNQNTTGSAAKWTTARNLAGNSVDGSAAVPFANNFIVQGTVDAGLSAAQFLGALGTGIVKNTTTTGVLSIAVAGDFPTLNQNTSGTAANLSGTPALPNGVTATTQAAADNSTKLSTTAYADVAITAERSATRTLTNARVAARTNTVASSATPTINTDTTDEFTITALAAAITSMTTNLSGTPTNGDKLVIRIKDNGTARAITWGASFVSSGVATLLATTVISKTHYVFLRWDSTAAKWSCLASDAVGY